MNYSSGTGRQLRAERRKARVLFYGLSLILLLYLALSLVFGERGVLTYVKLKRSHDALKRELAMIQDSNKSLKKEIDLLKDSGSFVIEKKAREDLNMAREDEYIFIFKGQEEKK